MQNLLQNKKVLIAVVVVILLLVGGGGYYYMNMKKAAPTEETTGEEEMTIETLSPEAIGLDFVFRQDGKAGKIVIKKPKGIKHIDYELSYEYHKDVVSEDEPPQGTQGIIGEIDTGDVKNGVMETEYREFGTCSSGHCRYDNVTSPIKITLKITKDDGKTYQSEKSFKLPE